MATRRIAFPILLLFCFYTLTSSLLPAHTVRAKGALLAKKLSCSGIEFPHQSLLIIRRRRGASGDNCERSRLVLNVSGGDSASSVAHPSVAATLGGLFSTSGAWSVIAFKALSSHPTPSVDAVCGFRHNALTIAQALIFPFSVLSATFATLRQTDDERTACRLYLGIAAASLWTAAAIFWGRAFSVGYDLFSDPIRYGCAAVYIIAASIAISRWKQGVVHLGHSSGNKGLLSRIVRGCVGSLFALLAPRAVDAIDDPSNGKNNDSVLYAASSLGLFVLTIMPQLVGFPTATIPTILGKRLSRAASGFTFLGAVAAYVLKDASENGRLSHPSMAALRQGLLIGAVGHLGLIIAKVIGVDGGGLIFSGRGLWEFYPSLVGSHASALLLMMITYSVLAFATFGNSSGCQSDRKEA